jgi:hypothetical protein
LIPYLNLRLGDLVNLLLSAGYGNLQKELAQLEPERCSQCGAWSFKDVPCRTCQKENEEA